MALGAETGGVRNTIVLQGLALASIGTAAGMASALGRVRPHATGGQLVFTVVPVVPGSVALLAVRLPAMRATRIDPSTHCARSGDGPAKLLPSCRNHRSVNALHAEDRYGEIGCFT
jgi:hypothetical protein